MSNLIEFINDRIRRYAGNSDILNATPAIVESVADNNFASVKLLCNGSVYKLKNLSGATIREGDACQVYYKKALAQTNAYIGAAQPNGGLVYLYLNPATGVITTSSKRIATLQFASGDNAVCFLSFTGEIIGTENGNISLEVTMDGVSVNSFAQTLVVGNKSIVSIHIPIDALSSGVHSISVVCYGHCNVSNIVSFIHGIGLSNTDIYMADEGDFIYVIDGDEATILYYIGEHARIAIPNKLEGKDVVAMAATAFNNSDVEYVEIPSTLTTIG